MKLSANEIKALAIKAARGAGLPLGHAEDMGNAAVWLAYRGALDALCTALEGTHLVQLPVRGEIKAARLAMAGPTVMDLVQAGGGPLRLSQVDAPAVMHALAGVSHSGVKVAQDGFDLTVHCDLATDSSEDVDFSGAVDVPDPLLDRLNSFAAQTYVPASEASRAAGAGAGLSDND